MGHRRGIEDEAKDDPEAELFARLHRAISGGLRAAIHAHGPITPEWIGSATKRVIVNLRALDLTDLAVARRGRKKK